MIGNLQDANKGDDGEVFGDLSVMMDLEEPEYPKDLIRFAVQEVLNEDKEQKDIFQTTGWWFPVVQGVNMCFTVKHLGYSVTS